MLTKQIFDRIKEARKLVVNQICSEFVVPNITNQSKETHIYNVLRYLVSDRAQIVAAKETGGVTMLPFGSPFDDEDLGFTREQLKYLGLYFRVPAKELIFLTHAEHTRHHNKGKNKPLVSRLRHSQTAKEKGSYNPLTELSENNFDFTPMLENLLGEASHCFEMLPLVQDIGILKNIIYSGIWNMYNHKLGKGEKHNDQ